MIGLNNKLFFTFLPSLVFALVFLIYSIEPTPAQAQAEPDYRASGIFKETEVIPSASTIYIKPGEVIPVYFNSSNVRALEIGEKSPVNLGRAILIFEAPTYTLVDWGKTSSLSSFSNSVGDILRDNSIELAEKDRVQPALDSPVSGELETITITRVAETELKEIQPLPFRTVNKDDPNLAKGQKRVEKGAQGQKELVYLVKRENGMEVSRALISTNVIKKPIDEIVYNGTKPVITVRCKYNDIVIAASQKYKQDPNMLCNLMMKESNGNSTSQGADGLYLGLYQYNKDFWPSACAKAGFAGASWTDPSAQIYTTAYMFSIGQGGRW